MRKSIIYHLFKWENHISSSKYSWVIFQPLGHVAVVARTTTPSASAVAVLVVPTGRFWTIKKWQKQSMTCVHRTIYIYVYMVNCYY